MKRTLVYLILCLAAVFVFSCSQKKEEAVAEESADLEEWKEMDAFHMVMAEAFHPYKDSANLVPAKTGAEAMAAEADKWAAAALPAKVDNEEIKEALQQLKTDTRAFADQTQTSASDEELGAALTNLHDQFHKLMEAWHGGGKHEHGDH